MADTSVKKVGRSRISLWIEKFKAADKDDKKRLISDLLFNNAMYIIIAIAVIFIAIKVPAFLSVSSIVNIVSLTAAKLPIALGIAGCIVLTGTDISAGRCVGLTACIAASLLQVTDYANKMFPNLKTLPLIAVILAVIVIGAVVGTDVALDALQHHGALTVGAQQSVENHAHDLVLIIVGVEEGGELTIEVLRTDHERLSGRLLTLIAAVGILLLAAGGEQTHAHDQRQDQCKCSFHWI